ncbi:hypothetical protein FACS189425_05940 [Clostridia bacterium]|nr:hypothetical protein FACS189425_05940 [Clostridia bacterium]
MKFKRLIPAVLAVFMFIPFVSGCTTNQSALNSALTKTAAVSSITTKSDIEISLFGATYNVNVTSYSSLNSSKTIGKSHILASYGDVKTGIQTEAFIEFDISNVNAPKFKGIAVIPERYRANFNNAKYFTLDSNELDDSYYKEELEDYLANKDEKEEKSSRILVEVAKQIVFGKSGNGFTGHLTKDEIVQIADKVASIDDDFHIDAEDIPIGVDGVTITINTKNGYVEKLDVSADLSFAYITTNTALSDYNKPVNFTFPVTNLSNSVSVAELEDSNDVQVYINGKKLNFPYDSRPKIYTDRTMLPARFIIEKLGGTVEYSNQDGVGVITARLADRAVTLIVDNTTAYLSDGSTVQLDVPPMIKNDRTLIPLRFASENLGKSIMTGYREFDGRRILSINIL